MAVRMQDRGKEAGAAPEISTFLFCFTRCSYLSLSINPKAGVNVSQLLSIENFWALLLPAVEWGHAF